MMAEPERHPGLVAIAGSGMSPSSESAASGESCEPRR